MGLFGSLFSKDEDKEAQAQQDNTQEEPEEKKELPKQDYIKLSVQDVCSIYETVRHYESKKFGIELLTDHIYVHDMSNNKLVWRKELEYALTDEIDKMYIKNVNLKFFEDLSMWVQDTNKGAFIAPYNNSAEENKYVVFFVGVRYKILTIHSRDASQENEDNQPKIG